MMKSKKMLEFSFYRGISRLETINFSPPNVTFDAP